MTWFDDSMYLRSAGEGMRIPHDQGGFIPTHDEVHDLITSIMRWYAVTSPDDIDAHNDELRQQYFPTGRKVQRDPQPPKPINAVPGHIYLIKSGPHHKIGRTKDMKTRIPSIGAKLPIEPEVILTVAVPDMAATERDLHALFADKRLNGEWFDLDEQDIRMIHTFLEASL